MRESVVEARVVKWAKDHGIHVEKLQGQHNRGKTDRLFFRQGKTVFCELKAPGCTPTALQERYMQERRNDQFSAEWFDDAALAIQWLRKEFF